MLAHASRADLQTTVRHLEQTRASLVAAPDADVAVRICIEALKTELYTRDPPCVQTSKLHGAIESAAKQIDAKKEALAKAAAALVGAEDHFRDLVDRHKALAAREAIPGKNRGVSLTGRRTTEHHQSPRSHRGRSKC